ncbi:MAG: signal peptidase II [Phycisphaerales bacterium]|nr:signal peptidase II [Phycisphaerales bacterium]
MPAHNQSPHNHPQANTYKSCRAWLWLLSTIIFGIVTDLVSKSLAFTHVAGIPVHIDRADVLTEQHIGNLIPYHESVVVIPRILDFILVLNPGAVFGIGAGQRWFFIIFTLIAVIIAFVLFAKWTKPRDSIAHAGFGLIIAGGVGNLYDRIIFGCVRDFIHPLPGVKLPFNITWPNGGSNEVWPYVSNIADLYLLIGIALLLIYTWKQPPESSPPKKISTTH